LLGELYCNWFFDYYKLPIVKARFFNIIGPGESPSLYRNVIPNFIWWAMNDKPLPITGTGEETRDFTYVDDIIQGTLLCGCVEGILGEAFNLASQTETKVIDVAKQVLKVTRSHSQIVYKQRRDWDLITRRCASIEKARKVLGYNPTTSVNKAIVNIHKWMIENVDNILETARF
jgi:nucleoside-diphosphate-sugar epimerase